MWIRNRENLVPNNCPVKIGQIWQYTNHHGETMYAKVLDMSPSSSTDDIYISYVSYDRPFHADKQWPKNVCTIKVFLREASRVYV